MPPLLVGWPFQVHEPGATVDPLALDRSTTRSEIAGVVTTEGPVAVGTGRSMTRVQALVASAALSSAMGAFMGFLLKQVDLPPGCPATAGPGSGTRLAAVGGVTRAKETCHGAQAKGH